MLQSKGSLRDNIAKLIDFGDLSRPVLLNLGYGWEVSSIWGSSGGLPGVCLQGVASCKSESGYSQRPFQTNPVNLHSSHN